MHYLADYGLFFAKIFTLVIALLILVAGILALILKNKGAKNTSYLNVEKLNDEFEELQDQLQEQVLSEKHYKQWHKQQQKQRKQREKNQPEVTRPRLFVLRFHGDIQASAVAQLREEITAILTIAMPCDEVVLCLDSPGGMVPNYGLAASQLQRLRTKQIPLTVIIDRVAASGGYLMACVANKILAAPFAIIGSIGVVAQLPNFHRWLQKHAIDFEQVTAGEYKRTLTVFGENTPEKREKLQEELEEIHHHFKEFIQEHRPQVPLSEVATGEHWLASKALHLQLIDGLSTSDDYLYQASQQADIFLVQFVTKRSLRDKMADWMGKMHAMLKGWQG